MIGRPSPNFDARPDDTPIDMLVLHYTGMPGRDEALARLTDPAAEVSAHYLIDEDGTCYALVAEEHRAWHAGRSFWRGWRNVNARSIGIELVNPGHEFGYRPFPEAQMASLIALAGGILDRHPIPARNVVAHSDIAPTRKEDPGELFDWPGLAQAGIGLWPAPGRLSGRPSAGSGHGDGDTGWIRRLALLGYDIGMPEKDGKVAAKAALKAFQRHFRPACLDGVPDPETLDRICILCSMIP